MDGGAQPVYDRRFVVQVSAYDPDAQDVRIKNINGQAIAQGSEVLLPSNARITVYGAGYFEYSPASGTVGRESFRYIVTDGMADSEEATFTIDITNRIPIAQDVHFFVSREEPTTLVIINPDPMNDPGWGAYDEDG
ncbi:MAG: Ig-like domain-containing protein, partial [Candidatus Caldarchaeum sp.]